MLDLDAQPTFTEFAALVGVSKQAISAQAEAGVLSLGMTWRQMILAYCSQLREQAAGRASGDLVLASERAALARAQRERIEMQNAVTRGELAPVVAIEQVLAQAGSKVAAVLDTIPGMIRRRVPGLSAADIELVASEVAKARNIAAAIRMADLDDEPEEAEALAADAAQAEVDA
jgi:phage terminase Nu1 subunit (DNA packaging protein)